MIGEYHKIKEWRKWRWKKSLDVRREWGWEKKYRLEGEGREKEGEGGW